MIIYIYIYIRKTPHHKPVKTGAGAGRGFEPATLQSQACFKHQEKHLYTFQSIEIHQEHILAYRKFSFVAFTWI